MIEVTTYTFSIVRTCNGVKSTIPDDGIKVKGKILLNEKYIKSVTRMENESLFMVDLDSSLKAVYIDYESYLRLKNKNEV